MQDNLDKSDPSELGCSPSPLPSTGAASETVTSFPAPPPGGSNVIVGAGSAAAAQRGARRLSGKTGSGPGSGGSLQPHSVDSGIGSPRSIPLYSPTTPITPKTSSSPSVGLSESSPEK